MMLETSRALGINPVSRRAWKMAALSLSSVAATVADLEIVAVVVNLEDGAN